VPETIRTKALRATPSSAGAGREPRLRTITALARALELRPAALLDKIE
jgi:hypothetical protein